MKNFKLTEGIYYFFEDDDVSIHFFGNFDDNKLISITDIIHSYEENFEEIGNLKQRIVYLIIEAFQNVIRYSKSLNRPDYFGFRKIGDNYHISTANTIEQKAIFKLKNNIDHLNSLTIEELKEKYKQTLINKEFSSKGGAGLGFIEMLRKTKQNIDYLFQNLANDECLFFFHLKYIAQITENHSITKNKDIYHFFQANNIILFIKFKYEKQIREILARFCAAIVKEKSYLVYHIIVEIIQNITYKNELNDQILLIHQYDDYFKISIMLNIPSEYCLYYVQNLQKIKDMDKEQLKEYFKILLVQDDVDYTVLSFVEILRRVKSFEFKVIQNEEETLFFLNCIV